MAEEETLVRVGVLGASGYAGGELVRLLEAHPATDVTFLGAKGSVGDTLMEAHPYLAPTSVAGLPLRAIEPGAIADAADIVFSSLPHGASAELAPQLLELGLRVVDLAGDFRLEPRDYPEWYGFEHPSPGWVDKAVYGLPELLREHVPGAQLVANPGCYPTPVILGLAPLLRAELIEPGPITVDGKTGLSGAGKVPTGPTTYASTEESVRPYRAPRHQHTPEMERGLELTSGHAVPVLFVPHLVPTVRGVLTTCYARLMAGVTTVELTECLGEVYAGRPFVRVSPPGEMVDSKRVRGTNVVELQALADPRTGTAVVVGAVDNLVKGAAGQAVQNMNLLLGLPEETALPMVAVYP